MAGKRIKQTILVVDDDEKIRNKYKEILSLKNFNCKTAADADEANELIKRNNIDLVLLDIKMPSVAGNVLYEIMRLFHQKVKVIISSVFPIEEQKKIISGATDYYDKSEGIESLLKKIALALNGD